MKSLKQYLKQFVKKRHCKKKGHSRIILTIYRKEFRLKNWGNNDLKNLSCKKPLLETKIHCKYVCSHCGVVSVGIIDKCNKWVPISSI